MVVPEAASEILCSAEFEVMRARHGVDPHWVAYLLYTDFAQRQIRSLTSGTSASHNRIKTRDLAGIQLPFPARGSKEARRLRQAVEKYRDAINAITAAYSSLADIERDRSMALD